MKSRGSLQSVREAKVRDGWSVSGEGGVVVVGRSGRSEGETSWLNGRGMEDVQRSIERSNKHLKYCREAAD